ncbi:MAG: hypothetical protein ACI8RZ_005650 [Myxococcota bacterium]|jgi:hypothetical protein
MLLTLLLACDFAESSADPAEVTGATDPITVSADPAQYADTWLVVVHSSRTSGELPESWDALVAISRDGARPERLNSSHFKGLMPCYEIVIAAGIPDRQGAGLLSEGLRVSGVDNYIKNAGAYVGPDPRIDAACEPAVVTAADGPDIAVSRAGALHLSLSLPDAVHERALEGVADPKKLADATSWSAPLPVQTIGTVSLGAGYTAVGLDGVAQDCTVTGFSALTEGQPHFGYFQRGELDSPGCGEPRIHAVLSCDAAEVALVVPAGSTPPTVHGLAPSTPQPLSEHLRSLDRFQSIHRDLSAQAARLDASLQESGTVGEVTGTTLQHIGVELITGEGLNVCGYDDLNAPLHAVVDADRQVVLPFVALPWTTPVGIAQVGSSWRWIVRDWTGTWELRDTEGDVVSRWERMFCDCAC